MTNRTPAQIGAANRRAGRELERAVTLELMSAGWLAQQTGSGISSPIDVLAVAGVQSLHSPGLVWLVQCKTSGYVRPAEREHLTWLAAEHGSWPVVAYWRKDGRKARQVAFKDLEGNEVQP